MTIFIQGDYGKNMPTLQRGATRTQKIPATVTKPASGKKSVSRSFVALLRGINVSGQKSIPMEKLRGVCEGLGWREVRLYITYLAATPDRAAVEALKKNPLKADEFTLSGRQVYLLCRSGYGKTDLSNAFFEKKLCVPATTRNLETTAKLVEMARET